MNPPYGLTVDGSLTEGSGGVKTPPYDVTYKGGTKRNRELTQGCGPGMPGPYRVIRSLRLRGFGALGGAQHPNLKWRKVRRR